MVNAGIRARRVARSAVSVADIMTLSPPIHSACTPRAASEFTASSTPDVLSTLASRRVIPSSRHAARAISVKTTEFDSAGFQATPTVCRPGNIRFAILKLSMTGSSIPCPTMCGG